MGERREVREDTRYRVEVMVKEVERRGSERRGGGEERGGRDVEEEDFKWGRA